MSMRCWRLVALLIAGVVAATVAIQAEDPQGLTPAEIFQKVTAVYSTCRTYRDEGRVNLQLRGPEVKGEKLEVDERFTTTFARPDRFLLDYQHNSMSRSKRSVIWNSKQGARCWSDRDGKVETAEDLDFALGSLTGVTSGASTEIPTLLFAATRKPGLLAPFSQLQDLKRLDDVKHGGVDCYQVQGRLEAINFSTRKRFDTIDTYVVEKAAFLIRQFRSELKTEELSSVKTISFTPQLDGPVAETSLTFDPPKKH